MLERELTHSAHPFVLRQAQRERAHAGKNARTGRVIWLGEGVVYSEALAMQRSVVAQRAEGQAPDTLFLLEHAPVYTAGRRAVPEHVVGVLPAPVVESDRGGQTTFHGPGQLVGYPIIGLAERHLGPKQYVRILEDALIEALGHFGIGASVESGSTGVWAAGAKIAAIGVRITQGVTMHGFALNVATDLSYFESIIPCGIPDRAVTSIAELGVAVQPSEVRKAVTEALGLRLGVRWIAS